jgi:hypothetical protein
VLADVPSYAGCISPSLDDQPQIWAEFLYYWVMSIPWIEFLTVLGVSVCG